MAVPDSVILSIFRRVCANLRKAAVSFVMPACLSVRLHGTTRLPLDGFFVNFDTVVFRRKSMEKKSNFIKI
jgi:hypothetical protein